MKKTYEMKDHAFITKDGTKMTRELHEQRTLTGVAYGFMYSGASRTFLQDSLNESINLTRTADGAQKLEVVVQEGINPHQFSTPGLYSIASEARNCGRVNYTLIARSELSNYDTGLDLGAVINLCITSRPELYSQGSTSDRIIYEQNGEYWDIE